MDQLFCSVVETTYGNGRGGPYGVGKCPACKDSDGKRNVIASMRASVINPRKYFLSPGSTPAITSPSKHLYY